MGFTYYEAKTQFVIQDTMPIAITGRTKKRLRYSQANPRHDRRKAKFWENISLPSRAKG